MELRAGKSMGWRRRLGRVVSNWVMEAGVRLGGGDEDVVGGGFEDVAEAAHVEKFAVGVGPDAGGFEGGFDAGVEDAARDFAPSRCLVLTLKAQPMWLTPARRFLVTPPPWVAITFTMW